MISISSRHLMITVGASTIILISILITGAIITLILRGWWRWRGSKNETTHDSLSSCDTTNTGVHLTQLITESVKVSIHAHNLCHDGLKCHSTRRRWRNRGGWSDRSWRSCRLCLGLPWSELCLAPSNDCSIYGTHHEKMRRDRKGDGKMAKYMHDSRRKNELITGRYIPIDIYKG